MIANAPLHQLHNLSTPHNNKRNPSQQQQRQKRSRLNKRIELIGGVVDGVESVVQAMQSVGEIVEGNVVRHEVLGRWGQDY